MAQKQLKIKKNNDNSQFPNTANPFEQCNTDASNKIIDQPKRYLKIFPNHITIPFDAAIILSIIMSHPFDVPATIHGPSMSWQQIENALWELVDTLNTRVGACDAGTKSDARHPVDVHIQKSNNRHQIIDRDIRKTMIFMRILDIIKEMERTSMCDLSILGDGGVVVLHSNHPNYPTERSRTLNSYPKHTERLRQLPNYTNPSNDPTTSPNPKHLRRQSSNEYRPRSFELSSATTTIILIISFLFLVHIQPVTGHYKGSCIGSMDRTQSVPCSTDDIYVYVNTNHQTITGGNFYAADQARVDVTGSGVTTFSRRPTKNNDMGYTQWDDMASVPNCRGKTVTGSNTNMICNAYGMQPNHCSGSYSNWFRYGPINKNGATTLTIKIYGFGAETGIKKTFTFTPKLCQCTTIGEGLSKDGCRKCTIGQSAKNGISDCASCTSGKYQDQNAASSWGCVRLELFLSKIKLIFLTSYIYFLFFFGILIFFIIENVRCW